ncbi:MAG: MogA/MoaB family molybdenum cofactor biosynthesis protein [Anaerolineaceae bacterium]|nr:MogA/MoaB family molybdenum cofactor biosynthesis protein [Anaerolineaceae bacterium]
MNIRVAILTISDRSATGERPDTSGPALVSAILKQGWIVVETRIVSDDIPAIQEALLSWCESNAADIVLTTGGTGFAPRDVTPEATAGVIERPTPGLTEAMRRASLEITPHAMLSRAAAGIRNRTLIVNLPGSPKGALENLGLILPILPHAVELLQENPAAEAHHGTVSTPGL